MLKKYLLGQIMERNAYFLFNMFQLTAKPGLSSSHHEHLTGKPVVVLLPFLTNIRVGEWRIIV